MSGADDFNDDEISLIVLWDKLRAGWRYVIGGAFVGLVGTTALLTVIRPTYEAGALLQTGKVAGAVIEDASTMVERLKSPSFLLAVAKEVNDQNWADSIAAGSAGGVLTAQVPKTSPTMVEVKVKARSSDEARRIAENATTTLIKRQDELSIQALQKIGFDLSVAKEKLAKAEQDLLMLTKTLGAMPVRDERFSQLSLLTSMKLQKDSEVLDLRQSVFALEVSLLPPSTQPARVLEDIFVSTTPASPKKQSLLVLGLVGGLLLGVAWIFVSSSWRQARERCRLRLSQDAI